MAYSSAVELLNDVIIAKDLKFMSEILYIEGREKIEYQTFLIAKLRSSQEFLPKPSKQSKPS